MKESSQTTSNTTQPGRPRARAATVFLVAVLLVAVVLVVAGSSSAAVGQGTIREVQRLTPQQALVLTDNALLATRDSGASWTDITPDGAMEGISDMDFVDASTGWLVGVDVGLGDRLVLLGTSDSGASWTTQVLQSTMLAEPYRFARASVAFADTTHGWLLGKVATSSAFSAGELYQTLDGGATWEQLPQPPVAEGLMFVDAQLGFLAAPSSSRAPYITFDGGSTWGELKLTLPANAEAPAFGLPTFESSTKGLVTVTTRGEQPQLLSFVTTDGGQSWQLAATMALPEGSAEHRVATAVLDGRIAGLASGSMLSLNPRAAGPMHQVIGMLDAPVITDLMLIDQGEPWALISEGRCDDGDCRQLTRLAAFAPTRAAAATDGDGDLDRNVDEAKAAAADDGTRTLLELTLAREMDIDTMAKGSVTSFNYGLDKCDAPSTSTLQTWINSSSYRDVNIYYGGSARACPNQTYLNTSWVTSVLGQGWRLLPTFVGPQAPCFLYGSNRFSSDPATAASQGQTQADLAISAAEAVGLCSGTPLYYDLETYPTGNSSCSAGVQAFVNAWVARVKSRGWIAGFYGHGPNAQADWTSSVISNPPDAVWIAHWYCGSGTYSCTWTPSVWDLYGLSNSYWTNNQRIRQYWGDHSETNGGVNIPSLDSDYANAPVGTACGSGGNCIASVASDHWKGEYYPNKTLSGSATLVRDDGTGTINFEWGSGGPNTCSIGTDSFSARWTRTFSFSSGTWRFTATSDDGVRVWVDGSLKIDAWIDQGPTTYTADVTLGSGNHTVKMEWYENGGGATAKLSWAIVGSQTQSFLCDDGDSCFSKYGPSAYWHQETSCSGSSVGYNGDLYWTYVNGSTTSNYIRWTPSISGAGNFNVWVWVPRCYGTTRQAKYRIYHNGTSNYVTVNQNGYYDEWVYLGNFYFAANGSEYVELTDATGESYSTYYQISFDAVYWARS